MYLACPGWLPVLSFVVVPLHGSRLAHTPPWCSYLQCCCSQWLYSEPLFSQLLFANTLQEHKAVNLGRSSVMLLRSRCSYTYLAECFHVAARQDDLFSSAQSLYSCTNSSF